MKSILNRLKTDGVFWPCTPFPHRLNDLVLTCILFHPSSATGRGTLVSGASTTPTGGSKYAGGCCLRAGPVESISNGAEGMIVGDWTRPKFADWTGLLVVKRGLTGGAYAVVTERAGVAGAEIGETAGKTCT